MEQVLNPANRNHKTLTDASTQTYSEVEVSQRLENLYFNYGQSQVKSNASGTKINHGIDHR